MKRIILLMLCSIGWSVHAEEFVPVCQRQPAIRSAIMLETGLPCEEISARDLAKVFQLGLYDKGITQISATDFQGLSNVMVLFLRKNEIEKIEPGTFSPLTGLTVLNLAENRIHELNSGAFDGLSKLRDLELWKNRLVRISPKAFRGLKSLGSLDLSNNQLTRLSSGTFSETISLFKLDLSSNSHLTEIPDFIFSEVSADLLVGISGAPLTHTRKAAFYNVGFISGLPASFDTDASNGDWGPQ